jgi:histidine triad (HIT) family protein
MNYDSNNIFAKIIRGEVPSSKVYEDEKILAFHDITKAAPIHVLVIPKGEYVDFSHFVSKAGANEIDYFFKKTALIAQELGTDKKGFRLITNKGSDANQTVQHFHVHILAGKNIGPLVSTDNILR